MTLSLLLNQTMYLRIQCTKCAICNIKIIVRFICHTWLLLKRHIVVPITVSHQTFTEQTRPVSYQTFTEQTRPLSGQMDLALTVCVQSHASVETTIYEVLSYNTTLINIIYNTPAKL